MNECRLEIDQRTMDAILRHLRAGLPYEGCGLLATVGQGTVRRAVEFFPGDNIDRSRTRFTMDPRQVVAAMERIEQAGWRLGAIVHSHPASPATPSETDLREACYPDVWLAIASFADESAVVQVWDVSGGSAATPSEVRLSQRSTYLDGR